jgi:hypothetical protein
MTWFKTLPWNVWLLKTLQLKIFSVGSMVLAAGSDQRSDHLTQLARPPEMTYQHQDS